MLTKKVIINSKKNGKFIVLVDADNYEKMLKLNSLKWSVTISPTGNIYFLKRVNGRKQIYLHRWIMNAKKGTIVDHIDRDTLNNTKKNLRFCTKASNCRNSGKQSNNTSGVNGVCFDKKIKKWTARIYVNKKQIYLGSFKDKYDASKTRKRAFIRYFDT